MADTYAQYHFFVENTGDGAWQEHVFADQAPSALNFMSQGVIIANDDGADDLEISFRDDGAGTPVLGGIVKISEILTFDGKREFKVKVRHPVGKKSRIFAW